MKTIPATVCTVVFGLPLLSGCLFAPQEVQYYDPKCKIILKKKTLSSTQIQTVSQCRGEACAAVLAGAGFVSAASLVVSGTIVIASNTVSWLETAQGCPAPRSNGRERQPDLNT
ncbi:hypothetical protein CWB99_13675 [Pseudoalteromonas rubra]|uniref:Lipoprotein n=1 Tax=Pseudoalteromonas rubra TaxID=43658 RepID=A0A5S3WK00_9GAMM|nr:hypothetical protein [Pseudoalteromonas rubra]TMP27737.1 hypothetical protein CWB99_13675 [Pseudoalteromonas rubra]TMP32465.1 hypothetical protein CWC00_12325 [Pseudoalteromonas rubra]